MPDTSNSQIPSRTLVLALRANSVWSQKPKKKILGRKLTGDIESVGKDVKLLKEGDQVLRSPGFGMGAYAEYIDKTERSNSSAIQIFLTIGEDTLTRILAWQDHDEMVTEQVFDNDGEIDDFGVTFEVLNNGGQVHIKIPAQQVGEANSFIVHSFDRINSGDDRGFDSTGYFPIPVP